MYRTVLAILLLVTLIPAVAAEHPACRGLAFDYSNLTSEELRKLAASCNSASMATLLSNRAYHLDLLTEYARLSQLSIRDRIGSAAHIESYRIHIALLESFAAQLAPHDPVTVDLLNAQYELYGKAAELRLERYEQLVKRTPVP